MEDEKQVYDPDPGHIVSYDIQGIRVGPNGAERGLYTRVFPQPDQPDAEAFVIPADDLYAVGLRRRYNGQDMRIYKNHWNEVDNYTGRPVSYPLGTDRALMQPRDVGHLQPKKILAYETGTNNYLVEWEENKENRQRDWVANTVHADEEHPWIHDDPWAEMISEYYYGNPTDIHGNIVSLDNPMS